MLNCAQTKNDGLQTYETTRALAEHMGKSVSTSADRPGAAGCSVVVCRKPNALTATRQRMTVG